MRKLPVETLAARAERFAPFYRIVKPVGPGPFPTVVYLHGCGDANGPQPHYATAAAARGVASILVNSFAPRGITLLEARLLVCSGMRLWGRERAGDVLASLDWARNQNWVDKARLGLAGWSHGAWSIMDALALGQECARHAHLEALPHDLFAGLKTTFLVYPWCGIGAQTLSRGWTKTIPTAFILAQNDSLAGISLPLKAAELLSNTGCHVETHIYPGATHSFDEETSVNPTFRYEASKARDAHTRFANWMARFLV
ncbi:dienelactone hydrolase family protein [Candidatus Phycosocius spiralis]|uniref:Dienelactone hydrolase n=1 Tax=Candidatus Phycosocius spiralis TaxID=2815099 RepID=A0ABQ4PVS2_9PROT|nr:prolyl oligopeptidase family serine peptidase [Candidatus Phycosocius spiralis]GIU67125.1 dienelactone hydrolase [Candidatus Phycosocius spiralis]